MSLDQPEFAIFVKPWKRLTLAELAPHIQELGFDLIELPVRPGFACEPQVIERSLPQAVAQLKENGVRVLKFFLLISRDEQAKRFADRLKDPTKNWKFSTGDLEERKHWDDYMEAYEEALARCSTEEAPWWIVPADRKWVRNWMVSRIIVRTLEEMKMQWPKPRLDLKGIRIE